MIFPTFLLLLISPIAPQYSGASMKSGDSGYETAEKGSNSIQPISATGNNQLNYIEGGEEHGPPPPIPPTDKPLTENDKKFHEIFGRIHDIVRFKKYTPSIQNEKFAAWIPDVWKDWANGWTLAPVPVQSDWIDKINKFIPTVNKIGNTFIDLTDRLATMWAIWQKIGFIPTTPSPYPPPTPYPPPAPYPKKKTSYGNKGWGRESGLRPWMKELNEYIRMNKIRVDEKGVYYRGQLRPWQIELNKYIAEQQKQPGKPRPGSLLADFLTPNRPPVEEAEAFFSDDARPPQADPQSQSSPSAVFP